MKLDSIVLCATLGIAIGAPAQGAAIAGQGTWETTLLGRDINGHAVASTDPGAVFAYDTVLDATWYLGGGNLAFRWEDAMNWAAALTIGKFSDWTLPTADESCSGYYCTGSQFGELWYTALGNTAVPGESNTGPFDSVGSTYWTVTEYDPDPRYAWVFSAGTQYAFIKYVSPLSVLAIRPGDVAIVPEPATAALLFAGLGLTTLALRRGSRKPIDTVGIAVLECPV